MTTEAEITCTIESAMTAPVPTSNMLKDIVDWVKGGDVVLLHDGGSSGKIYHNCPAVPEVSTTTTLTTDAPAPTMDESLRKLRVIWLDCAKCPSLLEDGEWPWFIENAGIKQCSCALQQRVLEADGIPNFHSFRVPGF